MSKAADAILGGLRAPRSSVDLNLRADLLARFRDLEVEHSKALRDDVSEMRVPEAPGILQRMRELQDEMQASTVTITFEALTSTDYGLLRDKHPATQDDRNAGLGFNGETFPPALIAACAIEVDENGDKVGQLFTEDQAHELYGKLTDGQQAKVWNTVCAVNIGDDAAPKGVLRSAPEEPKEKSSTTASRSESPDHSSLAAS